MGIQESYNRVAGEIQSQADLIAQIKSAIAEKAAGGDVELPAIDADVLGSASDLAEGKQLIGPDGSIVVGNLPISTWISMGTGVSMHHDGSRLTMSTINDSRKIFENGAALGVSASADNLGDATPADVRAGVTFTSKSGLKIPGELEVGVQLPDIDDSVLGSASDLVEGKKLIAPDGTVVTGEIPKRTSSDLTESGITVTAPAGYYASEAKKTVTVPTETKTVTSNGTYTPSSGKYFSSFTVNVGTSSGYKSGDIVKAFPASATLASGYNVSSVSASDSVTKNENGVVSLSGVTSTVAIGSIDNVKGRYVKASSGSIYYVPADATITQGGSTYSKTYTVDKANLMFVLA